VPAAGFPSEILSCLRAHGQCLDSEIARETGVSVEEVREQFAALLASGDVIACKLTRFDEGKPVVAMMYRASGCFPPRGAGRKPKPPDVTTVGLASATPEPQGEVTPPRVATPLALS
jgi:hypothetical protein